MAVTEPRETREPFHLISEVDIGGEAEPMLPVAWCIQPEFKEDLLENKITEPWLLIAVIHKFEAPRTEPVYTEMDRYILPLSKGMEYIRFSRAGKNIVKAAVVHTADHNVTKSMKKIFLSKNYAGEYNTRLIDYDGEFYSDWSRDVGRNNKVIRYTAERHDHVTEMEFEVPAFAFGKPSPNFERLYLNKLGAGKPVDQCSRRKRRLLWLGFPLYLIGSSIIKLITYLTVNLAGFREAKINPLFHPLSGDIADVVNNVDRLEQLGRDQELRSWPKWFTKKNGDLQPFPLIAFNPWSILAGWCILAFLANLARVGHHGKTKYHIHIFHLAWYESLWWSLAIHVMLFASIVIIAGVIMALIWVGDKIGKRILTDEFRAKLAKSAAERDKKWRAKQDKKKSAKRKQQLAELQHALDTMSCDTVSTKVSVNSLPKERRTIHLRFQAAKSRVCKPFAR